MYGYIYDIYLFLYLEVVKCVGKVKNKPCKSGFEVVKLERSRDCPGGEVLDISLSREVRRGPSYPDPV